MSQPTPEDASQSLTTHAVLEWTETTPTGHRPSYLTTPDPSDAKIIFKSDIATRNGETNASTTGVFVRLHIPLKLKRVSASTPVHIHIHPSRVQSCTLALAVDAPEAIKAASPGQLASLSMTLSGPVQVIVPLNMASSSPAKNRVSGRVLDALRSLRQTTRLTVYIPANRAPRPHLQRLSEALTGGGSQALPPYTELSTLFGGLGGRFWDAERPCLSTSSANRDVEASHDQPPPYQELSSEAAVSGSRDKKRRRRSSSGASTASTRTSQKEPLTLGPSISQRLALLEALVHAQTQQNNKLESVIRAQALQTNQLKALVHAQAVQINTLSTENRDQQRRMEEFEAETAAVRLEIGRVDKLAEVLDLEVAEQKDDIARLDGDLQYWLGREEEIVEEVTDAVTDAVTERISQRGLSATNITFTLTEG